MGALARHWRLTPVWRLDNVTTRFHEVPSWYGAWPEGRGAILRLALGLTKGGDHECHAGAPGPEGGVDAIAGRRGGDHDCQRGRVHPCDGALRQAVGRTRGGGTGRVPRPG